MYKELFRPILDHLDSETWHNNARCALHFSEISPSTLKILELFADQGKRYQNDRLKVILGGIELENPVMVGAGWDKEGKAVEALYRLGFPISTENGKHANEMTEVEWAKFFGQMSGQLKRDYPKMWEELFRV